MKITETENPYSKIYNNTRAKTIVKGAENRSETVQIRYLAEQAKTQ